MIKKLKRRDPVVWMVMEYYPAIRPTCWSTHRQSVASSLDAVLPAVYTQSEGDIPSSPVQLTAPVLEPLWSLSETHMDVAPPEPPVLPSQPSVNFPHESALLDSAEPITDRTDKGDGKKRNRRHRESAAEKEYHKLVQDYHKRTRKRHYTDPIDFEGILRIIGEKGLWQMSIYIILSLQQIPHTMFNLLIIFMMIKPPHWCYVPELDAKVHSQHDHPESNGTWDWRSIDVRNIRLVL